MAEESAPSTNRGVQLAVGCELDTISTRIRPQPQVGFEAGLQTDPWMRPLWVIGVGSERPADFIELLLDTDKRGNNCVLRCMRATASFFGWSDHYPRFIPGERYNPNLGHVVVVSPSLKRRQGWNRREYRIGRAKTTTGNVAGMTHRFRVRGPVTNRILADLAAHTTQEWCWMSTSSGERRSREKWLDMHEVVQLREKDRITPGGEGLAS